jgi:mannosylglycerate hydrolase
VTDVVGAWPFRGTGAVPAAPEVLTACLISHTHWDREWYASLEWFRSRLVVTVDRVLDLLAADPGWAYVLDGQVSVVTDYLADRPARRGELAAAVASGRLAIGPWYVQPDSLLPAGESHIRNLLEARAVASDIGPMSRVAYTPDSFGHPAWFPMLFAGFDLRAFVFWRGHGDERDELPARWRWCARDGSSVLAVHLEGSYLAAASLEPDAGAAAARLRDLASSLAVRSPGTVLLMNGIDHAMPDPNTADVARALGDLTGWTVRRTTIDGALDGIADPEQSWEGALMGARDANLLPGVWSSQLELKLANERLESALWDAEHLAAIAHLVDGTDERPVLRRVRRTMLENQAHDTIGGCSIDDVVRDASARGVGATAAARAAAHRIGGRLAGAAPDHLAPWSDEWDVAVWNPLPWPRRAVVAIPVNGWPAFRVRGPGIERHPAHVASLDGGGFLVDGGPCRVADCADADADRFSPDQRLVELRTEVELPAMGWTRVRVSRGESTTDVVDDDVHLVHHSGASVAVEPDGTVTYTVGSHAWRGLLAVVDEGDRGDTYDADPLDDADRVQLDSVSVTRRRHVETGLGELVVRRRYLVPSELEPDRSRRVDALAALQVDTTLTFDPIGRLEIDLRVESTARDHRTSLRMPLPGDAVVYATQFGDARFGADRPAAHRWVHPPSSTFCHQGWIAGGGALVVAPGLPEASWRPGRVDLTVLRAVGWMSRPDLRTRPGRASPAIPVPGAQTGAIRARLSIGLDPHHLDARWRAAAEVARQPLVGLAGVDGVTPLVPAGESTLAVYGGVVTAIKPAEDGLGAIVRVWNPTPDAAAVVVRTSTPRAFVRCRLDETPLADGSIEPPSDVVLLDLAPFEAVTLRLGEEGSR